MGQLLRCMFIVFLIGMVLSGNFIFQCSLKEPVASITNLSPEPRMRTICRVTNQSEVNQTDTDGDGWSDQDELRYETNEEDPLSYPDDNDGDFLPDSSDPDDDNDDISDSTETAFGMDPFDPNDVQKLTISSTDYYLLDMDNNTLFDTLYKPPSRLTPVERSESTVYLLDVDGDQQKEKDDF